MTAVADELDTIEVAGRVYTRRRYSKGGHGWVRDVGSSSTTPGSSYRAEVGAELKAALDLLADLLNNVRA
jgi:hypothetical protein